jgi:hypothetical protein
MPENQQEQQKIIDKAAEELAEWFLWRLYQDLNFPKVKNNNSTDDKQTDS